MKYAIKELFYTLQGEGANAGRPAVFCRFAGCNLWSGREADRPTAICRFCDTDFVGPNGVGGGQFCSPDLLARAVAAAWPSNGSRVRRLVVCTGGEHLLLLDESLVRALHGEGYGHSDASAADAHTDRHRYEAKRLSDSTPIG